MKTVIITGTSRGLGASLAAHLIDTAPDLHLICVARHENRELEEVARRKKAKLNFLNADQFPNGEFVDIKELV